MENKTTGTALDDWNNVNVVVSVCSLGITLLTKDFVGHADENTKLSVNLEINANDDITQGLVRQREQLLMALENARSAHMAGQHLDLREIDAAIAAAEQPAQRNALRDDVYVAGGAA